MNQEDTFRVLMRLCKEQGIEDFILIAGVPNEASAGKKDLHMLTNVDDSRMVSWILSNMTTKAIGAHGPDIVVDVPDGKDH